MAGDEELGALHILMMVNVMVACLFLGYLLEKSGTHLLQEAGGALLLGVGAGYVLLFAEKLGFLGETGDQRSFLHFDNDIFFNFILPPIIFSAGYTMRKRK